MTARMYSTGKKIYIDLPIDSPMAQVEGYWFGQPQVYGEFEKERIVLVVKGRMPELPQKPREEIIPKNGSLFHPPLAETAKKLGISKSDYAQTNLDWIDEVMKVWGWRQ